MENNDTIYYIYHIPGKKIGVTRNINKRVTEQQGYAPGEYEVLITSDDINFISDMEIELQKSYGYRVDNQKYKNLFKNTKSKLMEFNVTEQTTTFPWPITKLKGNLMDNLNTKFITPFGEYILTTDLAKWIVDNAIVSMYNPNRSYIYNKALSEQWFPTENKTTSEPEKLYPPLSQFELIRIWAMERGLYDKGDIKTQYIKLQEEAGEVARAIIKNDTAELKDGIGDMVVVLTNLAYLAGFTIEDCIGSAYDVISKRKGKMFNGSFVKNTL